MEKNCANSNSTFKLFSVVFPTRNVCTHTCSMHFTTMIDQFTYDVKKKLSKEHL